MTPLPLLLAFCASSASAAVSARWSFEDAYDNVNSGDWYRTYNNESATLAWGESYVMMGLVEMFEATGDPTYLDRLAWHADGVLAQRDDTRGVTDYRGESSACWRNTSYQSQPYCYAVHSGIIGQPIVEFARLVELWGMQAELAHDGQSFGDKAAAYIVAGEEIVAALDDEWSANGYYFFPSDATFLSYPGQDVPLNQSNTMGRLLLVLWDVTGDLSYLDKATRLARRFYDQLDLDTSSDAWRWNYWGGAYVAPGEDVSHAAINVDFAVMCAERGIVFTETDVARFANSFMDNIYVDDRTSYDSVGGSGGQNGSSYRGQLGRWAQLSPYRTAVYAAIRDQYEREVPPASVGSGSYLLGWALLARWEPIHCSPTFYYVDWADPDGATNDDWRQATANGANILNNPPNYGEGCITPLPVNVQNTVAVQQWDGAHYHTVVTWQSTGGASTRYVPYEPRWAFQYWANQQLYQFWDSFSASQAIQVQEVNAYVPPSITSVPPVGGRPNEAMIYTAIGTGDSPFWWSLGEFPTGARIDPASGVLSFTPDQDGAYDFVVRLENDAGEALQPFSYVVDAACAGTLATWYADLDGDGFGDPSSSWESCGDGQGGVLDGTDCDDSRSDISPGAIEVCSGLDDDCDGQTDEADAADAPAWHLDVDGDGWGIESTEVHGCTMPAGYAASSGDCNDGSMLVSPDATESCNGVDDDCDGSTDEDGAVGSVIWYRDADGDNDGSASSTIAACTCPGGYVASGADCDDGDASVAPAAAETCNAVDDDCDGQADEGVPSDSPTWYRDADSDGHGDAGAPFRACVAPVGYTSDSADCDDARADVSPYGIEYCDGMDNDCDGQSDESGAAGETPWYRDADGDGYGDATSMVSACLAPGGYVADNTDCDDILYGTHPSSPEICDDIDQDCDGMVDDGAGTTWYFDGDSDGSGRAGKSRVACSAPEGWVATGDDCDDTDPEAGAPTRWYADQDGDGWGDASTGSLACTAPPGTVSDPTDCDDQDPTVSPGATETPGDGVDQDCDGRDQDSQETAFIKDSGLDGDSGGTKGDCGCQHASMVPYAWVSLGFLALRRRRSGCPGRMPRAKIPSIGDLFADQDPLGDRTHPGA